MTHVLGYQMCAICLKPGVCSGFIQAFLNLKHDKIMAFLSIIVIYNICLEGQGLASCVLYIL